MESNSNMVPSHLRHLTAVGIAEQCLPLVETIARSEVCVRGPALLAYEKAQLGVAHAGDVEVLRDFANICQRVMDGRRGAQ